MENTFINSLDPEKADCYHVPDWRPGKQGNEVEVEIDNRDIIEAVSLIRCTGRASVAHFQRELHKSYFISKCLVLILAQHDLISKHSINRKHEYEVCIATSNLKALWHKLRVKGSSLIKPVNTL